MVACLADDVVFHSPVLHRPFTGKAAVWELFRVLLETFEEFRYTDETVARGVTILVFRTRVGDYEGEGVDIVRHGDDGIITDFTVMIRPLRVIETLMGKVAEGLADVEVEGLPW